MTVTHLIMNRFAHALQKKLRLVYFRSKSVCSFVCTSVLFTRNLKSVFLPQAHYRVDKTITSKIIHGSKRKTNTFPTGGLELLLVKKDFVKK
jgi:hypothetical protein